MVIGIHQPNFIPWLGFFYKIYSSDIFVLIDNVQFVKGSICNRNKIKNNVGDAVWITIPVKHSKGLMVNFNELEIGYEQKWQIKMQNQFTAAYQKAPYFNNYIDEIDSILLSKYQSLAEINIYLIKYFCKVLDVNTPIYIASELKQEFGQSNYLNLNITKYFGGDTYLSGQGAKKYNDEELFKTNNIKLIYSEYNHPTYPQINGKFISHLSIIDLLFNCGPESREILLNRQDE
jgi:hypothetical protein